MDADTQVSQLEQALLQQAETLAREQLQNAASARTRILAELSRHGVVAFAGLGTVASDKSELGSLQILPNWGFGYRVEVQPRMNVRVDVGYGREFLESGNKFIPSVYFNFTEAF